MTYNTLTISDSTTAEEIFTEIDERLDISGAGSPVDGEGNAIIAATYQGQRYYDYIGKINWYATSYGSLEETTWDIDVSSGATLFDTVTNHVNNTGNPHSVTAVQAGAIPATSGSVIDLYLGTRTPDQNISPVTQGSMSDILSTIVGRLKAILGESSWITAPKIDLSSVKTHVSSINNPHSTTASQVGAIVNTSDSVTDGNIGSRTANPATAPSGLSGTLNQWISWMTNRFNAIVGRTNWYDAPEITLHNAYLHVNSTSNPHSITPAQIGAPTTTGTGASGTWGINISGIAPWGNVSGKPSTISGYGITDGGALGANNTWTGHQTFKELSDTVYTLTGTTPALDPANGAIQTWTLTGISTPTDSLTSGQSLLLHVNDGSGYTINWPTISWVGGSAPVLDATNWTVIELWKIGSSLKGVKVGVVA